MQQQPENVAQLPKDMTDPIAVARRLVARKDVLVAQPQWRTLVADLLVVIDSLPQRTAAAVALDRQRRTGEPS